MSEGTSPPYQCDMSICRGGAEMVPSPPSKCKPKNWTTVASSIIQLAHRRVTWYIEGWIYGALFCGLIRIGGGIHPVVEQFSAVNNAIRQRAASEI